MSGQAPAGWYEDESSGLRYWDGSAWTDRVAGAATASPAGPIGPARSESSDVVGYSAVAAAVLGLIAVVLPWTGPELVGILLLIAGFVLSGIALHRGSTKWLGYVGLAVSIIGTIVGVVMFVIGFMHGYVSAVSGG
ncbi:DUF2510 domain-containing protein [Rathayibacter sp. CAU 1779]